MEEARKVGDLMLAQRMRPVSPPLPPEPVPSNEVEILRAQVDNLERELEKLQANQGK